jgi:hypothetical protein
MDAAMSVTAETAAPKERRTRGPRKSTLAALEQAREEGYEAGRRGRGGMLGFAVGCGINALFWFVMGAWWF